MKNLIKSITPRKIYLLGKFINDYIKDPLPRKKVCKNSTDITIVYLLQFPEVWNSIKSVYYAGESKGVNSYVVCIPKISGKKNYVPFFKYGSNDAYDFCKLNGIKCIRADLGPDKWLDIGLLKPDYVIYTKSYEEVPDIYSCHNLKYKYKLCYIPYAYAMTEGSMFYITFNPLFIRNMNYVFAPNKSRLEICKDEFYWYEKFGYCKFQFLGFPRFDLLSDDITSNTRNILWLPRWTSNEDTEGQKESHFLKYYKQFIEYMKVHPEINLIIRPHPLMFDNFIEKGVMTRQEVETFKDICDTSSNIELDESKDYLPTIKKAGILVADYTSLLVEYFVTGNPIIYCDDVDGLNAEAHLMDKAFYHADNFDQIEEIIERICNHKDPYASLRKDICKEIIPANAGSIGMEIINFIIHDYNMGK
jgi:hypothetical protein